MADVKVVPKIRCDNCGHVAEKQASGRDYRRPRDWGSLHAQGSLDVDAYGGKATLQFVDLCPHCAQTALDAASAALKVIRGETREDRT